MGSYLSSCMGGLALFLQPLWFCLCPAVQWSCLGLALPRSSSLFVIPWVLPGPFTKGPPIFLSIVLWPYILVTLLGLPAIFCLDIPSIISTVIPSVSTCLGHSSLQLHIIKLPIIRCLFLLWFSYIFISSSTVV